MFNILMDILILDLSGNDDIKTKIFGVPFILIANQAFWSKVVRLHFHASNTLSKIDY